MLTVRNLLRCIIVACALGGSADAFNFHPSESGSGIPDIDPNLGAGGFLPPGSTQPALPPLDTITTAGQSVAAAYSTTRALSSNYCGNLFKVIRTSDSTSFDVPQLANGSADVASMNTFCSATTCKITTIYDQGPSHLDLVQGASTDPPLATTATLANGKTVVGANKVNVNNFLRTGTRNGGANNGTMPTGTSPVTEYWVIDSNPANQCSCCFNFGETETTVAGSVSGNSMALYTCSGVDATGTVAGPYSGMAIDSENSSGKALTGNLAGTSGVGGGWDNPTLASAVAKTSNGTTYTGKGGNAQLGTLTTFFSGAALAQTNTLQGGLGFMENAAGISNALGMFYEGYVIAGATSDATDNLVQANYVAYYGTAQLLALTLDNAATGGSLAQGTVVGNILGRTYGSTLAITSQSQANAFQIATSAAGYYQLQAGTAYPTTSGTYTVTVAETLAGASNTPKSTTLSVVVTVVVASCTPSAFDPTNPAGSGYVLVRSDNFANLSTIDLNNTKASGFHWYVGRFFGWGAVASSNFTTDANGLVLNTPDTFSNFSMGSATDNATGGYVGTVFSGGMYIEASMAFDSSLFNFSNGWPSFWSMAVEHMQGTHNDQWPGQAAGYEHFMEDDYFEYDNPNGTRDQWGSAMHDWFGNPASQINNAPGGNTPWNNAFQVKPGSVIVWNATTFHTLGHLYVAGSVANGGNGYVQTYIDGVASVSTSSPASTKVTWTDTITTPAALPTSTAVFAIQDQDHMVVILGTANNIPYHIGHVNIWMVPGCGVMTSQ